MLSDKFNTEAYSAKLSLFGAGGNRGKQRFSLGLFYPLCCFKFHKRIAHNTVSLELAPKIGNFAESVHNLRVPLTIVQTSFVLFQ